MENLGKVKIFIPKGSIVTGIVLAGADDKPLGGCPVKPIRPGDGDSITIEFEHAPEKI